MRTDSISNSTVDEEKQEISGDSSVEKSSIQNDVEEKSAFDIVDEETVGTNDVRVSNAVITGWQLNLVLVCLLFALLLSTLETTIVATTLVNIASSFGQFDISGWIVVAYLLTYTGFLIVFARLSDFFGRKNALLLALAIFTIFSGICGAAQSMEQLIIFRAFQGIGGSGIYSMVFVVVPEIVPLPKLGLATGGIGAVYAVSSVLGPTLGGAIVSRTTWRWIFLLNVPCGVIILALVLWKYPSRPGDPKFLRHAFAQIDWLGFLLLITGSVMLVFPLQEGGLRYPWDSGAIIASFVVAGLCWIAFVVWEGFLSRGISGNSMVAVFPLQLVKNRIVAASLATAFLVGFPYILTIVSLPQRFQVVNNKSPISAGLRCLPLLLSSAVGAGVGGAMMTKKNFAFWVLLASNLSQVLGTGLLSSIPISDDVLARTYGFQVIMGIGIGLSVVSLMLIARVELSPNEQAAIIGAITQLRILGAVIGLAISTTALQNYIKPRLTSILSPEQLSQLSQFSGSITDFPSEQAAATRLVYNNAYNLQMRIVMGFALASLVISLLAFRRRPLDLKTAGLGEGERVEAIAEKETT